MTHLELREKFFKFWKEAPREHTEIPSSPLVPENDPTTLFTGSGMQPLIPYLLGQPHPLGKRLVDIQKCFRGQDIDEVGDNRHDTFFEMMGNWSLGDYFKEDQLKWYLDFLVKELGLPKNKLYISCFEGNKQIPKDTESANIWKSLGIPESRIYYYGVDNNWWSRSGTPEQMPAGEIGGPDSEVYYEFDIPHDAKFGKECHPACECGKYLEIGNSVFIQYQKQADGTFRELPQKNVDFGGGVERTLAAKNGNPDIFYTDLYIPIITKLQSLSSHRYKYHTDVRLDRYFRIVSDHAKAVMMLVSDGILPSNKDRGYVARRLLRKAIWYGRNYLFIEGPFMHELIPAISSIYNQCYPELLDKTADINSVVQFEENKFLATVDQGKREMFKRVEKGGMKRITGGFAFQIYETYGLPPDILREELLINKNIPFSAGFESEFLAAKRKHSEDARTASIGEFKGGLADNSEKVTKYHTSTHLLQAALRKVLGEHVHQGGSNITAERLRFDFSHPQKLTAEEIKKVEDLVNEQIDKDLPRKVETMDYDKAIASGALAFFKERYPEKVTVYSFGGFSREICGGPHVERTGSLGKFKITREETVASGIRRIYAVLE